VNSIEKLKSMEIMEAKWASRNGGEKEDDNARSFCYPILFAVYSMHPCGNTRGSPGH
jgi:hypothetical protein